MSRYIPLILAAALTNAVSHLMLKRGMNDIGQFEFTSDRLLGMLPIVALNPWVVSGLTVLVFSMSLHLLALSRVDISFVYPILSVSYVVVLVVGHYVFGESMNVTRVIGIALICIGTYFVASS